MQDPVTVAEFQSFHSHEHPTLDVCALKYERLVLDDGFEVGVEKLEDQVQVGLV